MIRSCLILSLFFIGIHVKAQKIKISGTIKAAKENSIFKHEAVLNDTLNRFSTKYLKEPGPGEEEEFLSFYNQYRKLSNDAALFVRADQQGHFSIMAAPGDSILFRFYNHLPQIHAVKDLLLMDQIRINLDTIPCIPYQRCNQAATRMYVFIAEKISLTRDYQKLYCNRIVLDGEYDANYKIIKNIYGDYPGDSIAFKAYDHNGIPAFSRHPYVMLFVGEFCGKLVQLKYEYFDVYPTANGRWASPGDPMRFDRPKDATSLRGEIISWGDLNFDKIIDTRFRRLNFQEPYFSIVENCVIPVRGAYVEDLFELKKKRYQEEGIFKFSSGD